MNEPTRPPRHTCTMHTPGTYACYSRHACPCPECRDAGRRRTKLNAHRRATNTRDRLPADPVREHVQNLTDRGMGRAEVARLADVGTVTITRLLRGETKELRRDRALRLLAVRVPPVTGQEVGMVQACGLTRRVEGLNTRGWSTSAILAMANLTPGIYRRALQAGRCQAGSRAAIAEVYNRLENQPAPPSPSTSKTLLRAARLRFPPPAAWDNEPGPHCIDDPAATPSGIRKGNEPKRRTNPDDIAEAVKLGASLGDMVARFSISEDGVEQALRRHGHADLWAKISPLPKLAA